MAQIYRFFEEFKVLPGDTYRINICAINQGCRFRVKVETGMKGNPGISEIITSTRETFSDWKCFEYTVRIPQSNDNLRLEVNILSPGTIWFDDIRIEGTKDTSELRKYPYRGEEECK